METLIPSGAKRGVAVVAHADDESLWCGGLIARGDLDWTIICCTIADIDPIRAYKFFDACDVLGAKARLLPFRESQAPIKIEYLDLSGFDLIVTHGAAGEYGHPHHQEVHQAISKRYPNSRYFGYRKGGTGRFHVPLDDAMKAKKLAALKCYNHSTTSDHGHPKWQTLLAAFEPMFDLWNETYD